MEKSRHGLKASFKPFSSQAKFFRKLHRVVQTLGNTENGVKDQTLQIKRVLTCEICWFSLVSELHKNESEKCC